MERELMQTQTPLPKRENGPLRVGLGVTSTSPIHNMQRSHTIIGLGTNNRTITVQRDKRRDGEFYRDETGAVEVYTKRKDGDYRIKGGREWYSFRLALGMRAEYMEPGL